MGSHVREARPVAHNARVFIRPPALFLACLGLILGLGAPARAERQHTVRGGQTMARIAQRYNVTVWSLAAANNLKPSAQVQQGQVLAVPEQGVVYVNEGQTLWSVARRHKVTVEELAAANSLKVTSSLRPGMRLVLPGHSVSKGEASAPSAKSWGKPKQQGRVNLYRVATKKNLTITIADPRGRVRPNATNELSRFLRPKDSKKTKTPPRRLLSLLAQVSDHFGGRKIHVISGYRLAGGYTKHESRHVAGAAIDFRVEGVPNRVLRDYLRHFDDVGVGFYPNSTFVHFDVREENAYWVDMSSPGQKPTYLSRAARDSYGDAERNAKDTPIDELVEAALEGVENDAPEEDLAADE